MLWRTSRRLTTAVIGLDVLASLAQAATLIAAGWVLGRLADEPTFGDVTPGVVAAALGVATNLASTAVRNDLSELASDRTRAETSSAVLGASARMPYAAFDDPTFYDALRRAHEGGSQHVWRIANSSFGLVRSVIDLVTTLAVLVVIVPIVIPVALVAYLPLSVVSTQNNRMLHRLSWGLTTDDRRVAYLESLFAGRSPAKEIRTFGLQDVLWEQHRNIWTRRMDAVYELARTRAVRSVVAQVTSAAVVGAALALVVLLTTSDRISLSAASVGVLGVRQLATITSRAGRDSAALHRSALYLEDYTGFLARAEDGSSPAAKPISSVGRIRFDSVAFMYPGAEAPALADVSITFESNEVTAIVGTNGAGKSTLIGLLCGLYRPTTGTVAWDDLDTRDVPETSIQQSSSVLFQDFSRLEFTVAEAIDPTGASDRSRIVSAARRAGIEPRVEQLPAGFDTQLGRQFDGEELSGGQWQRLALARALAADAALLVLDEPGAALDAEAEQELVALAREEATRRPVVFVSHRFGSVRAADKIVVLDAGRIVEVGDHATLLAANGLYAHLFRLQATPFTDAPGQTS